MQLDREQAEIIMTALQNYRGELYIDGNNSPVLEKVNKLVLEIEDEMESKEIKKGKIPVTKDMYEVKGGVGSETGIERDYASQGKPGCEVCDD